MAEHDDGMTGWSDDHRELVECCVDPVAGGDAGGEFVVTAAQVLHDGMPGGEDPRGSVAFQAAHRPEPGLQPDAVGGDLGRDRGRAQRSGEERRAAARSRRWDSSTPMSWPCWSTAR
jgi:hypothetical protein